jgi:hypothetical protein
MAAWVAFAKALFVKAGGEVCVRGEGSGARTQPSGDALERKALTYQHRLATVSCMQLSSTTTSIITCSGWCSPGPTARA